MIILFSLAWLGLAVAVGYLLGAVLKDPRVLLVVIGLGFAASASAQERPRVDWASYSVMVAGNVADLVTTKQAFDRGAHEGNGITSTTQIVPMAISKGIWIGGVAFLMRQLETHGHRTWAKVIGHVDGGVTFAAAMHNRGVR